MWLYFIHGPTVLFHCSVCLLFYQCHSGFATLALLYNLKSGVMRLPVLFFLLRFALAIESHFGFYVKFSIVSSSCVVNAIGILIGIMLMI